MIRSVLISSTLAFTSISLSAATQAPQVSQNSQSLFRSDQILLDAQKQQHLASYFCELAKKRAGGSPEQLRTAYKALLLSQSLGIHPKRLADTEAHIKFNQAGKALPPSPPEPGWVREILKYLSTVKLKQDNLILAELGNEVIEHSKNTKSKQKESKYWLDSVPELKDFQRPARTEQKIARDSKRKEPKKYVVPIDTNEKPEEILPVVEPEEPALVHTWKQKSFSIPLIQGFYSGTSYPQQAEIEIVDSSSDPLIKAVEYHIERLEPRHFNRFRNLDAEPETISPRGRSQALVFSKLWQQKSHFALSTKWPNQQAAKITLKTPESYNYSHYSDPIISTALSKLSASLKQENKTENYIIISEIPNVDELYTHDNIWNIINDLETSKENLLIFVPKSSEETLLQAKKIGYINIFLQHEIIAIEKLEDAENYLIEKQSEAKVEADLMFQEIKDVLKTKSTATMLKNRFVQQKISETAKLNPQLLSAKCLITNILKDDSPVSPSTMVECWTQILEPTATWLDYTPFRDPSLDNFDTKLETNILPDQLIVSLEFASNIAPISTKNRYRTLYRQIDELISEISLYSKSYRNDQSFTSKLGKSKLEGKRSIKKSFNELQIMLSGIHNL